MSVFLLAIGGGVGAIMRYLIGKWIMKKLPHPPFPLAMLTVNILGSFGLGSFLALYMNTYHVLGESNLVYLVLGVGFFGALTTFSTFSVEASNLMKEKLWKKFFCYVAFSIIGSILSFITGFHLFVV